ncbi:MAG: bifunctional demethylmenaquinone methyltransferase/2-methoxy-6-polyprenyl-1,4-benzoquinol methylase UbiE [Chitinophagaceae bacterium]
MAKFAHDDIKPYHNSNLSKSQQVASMFDNIAAKYDFLNHFLSIGIDVSWRRHALDELKSLHPKKMLDVATGTGDVAIMAAKRLKPQTIVGLDLSEGMLNVGKEKIAKAKLDHIIEMVQGDSENLPFEDNTFDAVTVSFGVRNFQNLEKGLKEMYRVLRPGGKCVIVEFSRPKQSFFKGIYKLYMNVVTPNIGKMVSRNYEAYEYLNESAKHFPDRSDFAHIMDSCGYTDTQFIPQTMGICCIYTGEKR